MLKFALGIGVLALSGCATASVMNGIMSSWEGARLDDVVGQWGYPHEEREFNGRKLYVWHHNKSAYIPPTTTSSGTARPSGSIDVTSTTTGGYELRGACDRILEVDERGTVVKWQWQGNNCPFSEAFGYKNWRRRAAQQ